MKEILSNKELLEIIGGSNAFLNVDLTLLNSANKVYSDNVAPSMYNFEPVDPIIKRREP